MQQKSSFKNLLTVLVLIVGLQITQQNVFAGEMVIEVGTVFSDTFVKDGRRVEVTKTYTWEGVVIHQKIYNSETGVLIRESTTTNPIKDNVRLVSDSSQEPTATPVAATPSPQLENVDQTPEGESVTPEPSPTPSPSPKINEAESEQELDFGPEQVVEESKSKYDLEMIDEVLVKKTEDGSNLIINARQTKKLLGIFTVTTRVQLTIDAETGEIIKKDEPVVTKVINLLSGD